MQDGDIILKVNETKVDSNTKMSLLKKDIHRGDSISFVVLRDEKEQVFRGRLADAEEYDLFVRKQKSGQIKANFIANTFYVETSRVKSFSIYIHPAMVQLQQAVVIIVNGKEVYNKKVEMNLDFLLKNYNKYHDKVLLYIDKIDIEL